MKLVIVSGLSGAGKTVALKQYEDLGYYCIDNLPAVLLPKVADEIWAGASDALNRVAISIDSRNRVFLQSLTDNLDRLDDVLPNYTIIYLESDESVLIQRYSETRRKHPLTNEQTSLLEGIRLEHRLLEPLADRASRRIDTSQMTPHELRGLIRDIAGAEPFEGPTILFESFGYKHGTPLDADFVFDVRCLPNPYWQSDLKDLTGLHPEVVAFLDADDTVREMVGQIRDFLETWLPRFAAENRSYITVALGCTGGQHRSVYMAHKLSEHFQSRHLHVLIRHRELPPQAG
jgi:UPF0042 nucleotide-binding protein